MKDNPIIGEIRPKRALYRGKYDTNTFIIPGQDHNEESVREYCRITPTMDRAVDVIVGSKKFPFRTKGDLFRWAIKFGLDHLASLEDVPLLTSLQAQTDTIIATLNDENANQSFMDVFTRIANTVGMHIQAEAHGEARRLVTELKVMIERIDSAYWKQRYLKELKDRFGYLLKASYVPGAKAGTHTDHGVDERDHEDE